MTSLGHLVYLVTDRLTEKLKFLVTVLSAGKQVKSLTYLFTSQIQNH